MQIADLLEFTCGRLLVERERMCVEDFKQRASKSARASDRHIFKMHDQWSTVDGCEISNLMLLGDLVTGDCDCNAIVNLIFMLFKLQQMVSYWVIKSMFIAKKQEIFTVISNTIRWHIHVRTSTSALKQPNNWDGKRTKTCRL